MLQQGKIQLDIKESGSSFSSHCLTGKFPVKGVNNHYSSGKCQLGVC